MAQLAFLTNPAVGADPSPGLTSPGPRSMDLSKVTTPILLHLLRDEIGFPKLFLMKCRMTVGRFKKTIDPKCPRELIDLAALPLWVYLKLKQKIGEKKSVRDHAGGNLDAGHSPMELDPSGTEKKRRSKTFATLRSKSIRPGRRKGTHWKSWNERHAALISR